MSVQKLISLTAVIFLTQMTFAQQAGTSSATFPEVRAVSSSSEYKPHVGINVGVASPEGSFRNVPGYGIEAGYQPMIPFGLGIEVTSFSSDRSIGSEQDNLNRTTALVKGTYNFGGDIPVLRESFVGLGVGPVFDSHSTWNGTHFGIAPVLGFDIPLIQAKQNYMSLGLSAQYVFVSGPSPDGFSLNGAAKYWF